MPETNPYEPSIAKNELPTRRSGWVRPFMILNVILVGLPLLGIAYAYISMQLEIWLRSNSSGGDFIVYETEFIGFSGPVWPMVAYLVGPNVLMLAYLAILRRKGVVSA